ncbi:MAG: stage III sporulation protein AF [Lachnospiraceae bacterium]|nr:stage III sporulation protein AF [Lachnospiraceae bacterium]
MTEWIKSLAASVCLMTILLHLVPENRFSKYVRFYAGLLFFLLVMQPVLELLGSADELERLLQLEFLKEDYYNLESAAEGLNDLKNEQIQAAYQNELQRQAVEIVSAYGLKPVAAEMEFGGDGYSIESLTVTVEAVEAGDASGTTSDNGEAAAETGNNSAVSAAVSELAALYLIPESSIKIITAV